MAQKTAWDGASLTESDINEYLMHEGGAWTSHTPQIDQGVTNIAKTVSYSKYARAGRMITWTFRLVLTAGGTGGSNVSVTLPTTIAGDAFGAGNIFDVSTSTMYNGTWISATTTTLRLVGDWSGAGFWGSTPSIALASGDVLRGSITYEAVS